MYTLYIHRCMRKNIRDFHDLGSSVRACLPDQHCSNSNWSLTTPPPPMLMSSSMGLDRKAAAKAKAVAANAGKGSGSRQPATTPPLPAVPRGRSSSRDRCSGSRSDWSTSVGPARLESCGHSPHPAIRCSNSQGRE